MTREHALERLAGSRPTDLDAPDPQAEDEILSRILAARQAAPVGERTRMRPALALVAAGLTTCAIGGWRLAQGHDTSTPARTAGGPIMQLAGYSFRLPHGYRANTACSPPAAPAPGSPITVVQSLEVAAGAAGGCLQVELASGSSVVPASATPVAVGGYQGYETTAGGNPTLYVVIPASAGADSSYLIATGVGLTAGQLVSIIASGLPAAG